jgi:hypothetical protein
MYTHTGSDSRKMYTHTGSPRLLLKSSKFITWGSGAESPPSSTGTTHSSVQHQLERERNVRDLDELQVTYT